MYVIALYPFLKWLFLSEMMLFYGFLVQIKKHKIFLGIHFLLFILCLAPAFFFKIIDVNEFKGFYTANIIQILFLISFIVLSILFFKEKQVKVYKKVIIGIAFIPLIFIAWVEYMITGLGGYKDPTDRIYRINDEYILRKQFIDYGRPIPYKVEKSSLLLFKKTYFPSQQMSVEDFDSLKYVNCKDDILKFNIYLKGKPRTIFIFTQYDGNDKPESGLVRVTKNGKDGFVDMKGNVIIPLEYNHLEGFNDFGECVAYKNGKVGMINLKNQIVKPFK